MLVQRISGFVLLVGVWCVYLGLPAGINLPVAISQHEQIVLFFLLLLVWPHNLGAFLLLTSFNFRTAVRMTSYGAALVLSPPLLAYWVGGFALVLPYNWSESWYLPSAVSAGAAFFYWWAFAVWFLLRHRTAFGLPEYGVVIGFLAHLLLPSLNFLLAVHAALMLSAV